MKHKKSQVSVEYIIIFSALLFVLFLIIFYFIKTIPEELKLKQATDSVNKLARTIDSVYAVGPGARRIIYINLPIGTQYLNLTPFPDKLGGEISLGLNYQGKIMDIIAITNANITGIIPPGKTLYKLKIQTTENRIVNVTSQ